MVCGGAGDVLSTFDILFIRNNMNLKFLNYIHETKNHLVVYRILKEY